MITLRTTQSRLRQSDLWAEANLFFPAAGETAKTAVSAAFFYLSSYPARQEKLAWEIRPAFTSVSQINGQTLSNCTFLRACIDEALRMSPPAAGSTPGITVGVNTYSVHHNEEYFPDSFIFRPERWLDDETSQRKVIRDAFVPFSVGPRGCAGKSMAYLEIFILLAETIWHFDSNHLFKLMDNFTASHDDPCLSFRKRQGQLENTQTSTS
ncbi:cytochrome P450 [Xylariaceae sp. FL1019]|nr:cytochrome P450 [Xylariaceae sp. FL1019]